MQPVVTHPGWLCACVNVQTVQKPQQSHTVSTQIAGSAASAQYQCAHMGGHIGATWRI